MFLRLQEKADPTFRKKLGALKGSKYRNDLVFPSPLPRDESMELDKSKKRFDMGITSKRRELEKLEGLSQSAIDKVLKDAAEEREQELEQEARFGAKFLDNEQDPDKRSGNEDPKRPDPEVQGTKVSQKAEDSKTPKT